MSDGRSFDFFFPSWRLYRAHPQRRGAGRPAGTAATRIELVINFKTAKVLALTFSLSLLGRADKVIE